MDGNEQTNNLTTPLSDTIKTIHAPRHEHTFFFCQTVDSGMSKRRFVVLACHCGNTKFVEVPE